MKVTVFDSGTGNFSAIQGGKNGGNSGSSISLLTYTVKVLETPLKRKKITQ